MKIHEANRQFQVQLSANGRSIHTRKQFERHVAALIGWLEANNSRTDLDAITPTVVAEFFGSDAATGSARGGKKKATSANAQRTSLRCFFRWAHESGLTVTNVARLLKRARCSAPPPRALHDDEQERLLKVLAAATGAEAERDRTLVELLLGTGIRIGSALALDVADLDFVHAEVTLRTTKGDRPTTAVLPATVAEKLKAFVAGRMSGPVFLAGDRRICMRHAQRRLAGWFAAAGISGRSAHSLRHSFATSLLARTGDLRLVQAAMNHASIVSTTIYVAVDRAKLRKVIGA
jgi:integrase/recombinase XerC